MKTGTVFRFVFAGQVLRDFDDVQSLAELGVSEGVTIHCLVSIKGDMEQRLECHPHSCSIDGGRVVNILGRSFPSTTRLVCRFGTVVTPAEVEDDGAESGIATLKCIAPPHPAGPVTLGLSFDGGVTWLNKLTFWYADPCAASELCRASVPSSCKAMHGVASHVGAGRWQIRRDHDPDNGPDMGSV